MKKRVEVRLSSIQEDFFLQTEIRAEEIFETNHKIVRKNLAKVNKRIDDVEEYHNEIIVKYDVLFK